MRNGYKMLVGKSEGKRPFGRCRRKWDNNTKLDLKYIGWEFVD